MISTDLAQKNSAANITATTASTFHKVRFASNSVIERYFFIAFRSAMCKKNRPFYTYSFMLSKARATRSAR